MTDATPRLSRQQALRLVEGAYLAAATGLIWLALYYLPVGGALFRLALPLPLILLQLRRGNRSGAEGLLLSVLLLTALMGPLRGPLLLFPYGLLSLWLGWSWCRGISWWLSWSGGVVLGTAGFLVRVLVLSLLVGENLWVVITRAGSALLERLIAVLHLPIAPDLIQVQLMALLLVVVQEVIYVLSLHALAYWIFPRLKSPIPEPPRLLHGLIALDPL
ncbi:hypothetical protein Syncc8109_0657 [Synechococcus sp. WH 8109]|uniref:DUF2232 domain-containing protein n=1 Tax=Synechococcus sp. WH 8109 TaxID=166314 RepID=UPI0001B8E08D|nr:DUF2232 domain-containing protein [Synechococcus sp. WH 8109]AHF63042.1 hypothetical protein Syncc8109_0657 [Synechococcus sp. WH 8109]